MLGVLADQRALAVTMLGDYEQFAAGGGYTAGNEGITRSKANAPNTPAHSRGTTQIFDRETNRLALSRDQQHIIISPRQPGPDQFIIFFQMHRNQTSAAYHLKLTHRGLLDLALLRRHDHIITADSLWYGNHRRHALARLNADQVDDMLAFG